MSDCIEWGGARNRNGYGSVRHEGRTWLAHRLAWTLANGPIPDGLHVRHRCDNPPCVNVEHLELGTHADNMRDMFERGRAAIQAGTHLNANKTHCIRGHEFTPENTKTSNGARECRACKNERQRAKRQAAEGYGKPFISVQAARNKAKTHCKAGHPFDEMNTYLWNGHRHCKTCSIERQRARRAAAKAEAS